MHIPTGEEIRRARKANGLSQSAVAAEADVSQPLVSRIENEDVDPRLSTLHSLSLAINGANSAYDTDRLEVIVPDAIKNRRQQNGLTQRELAEAANISQPMVSRIEGESVDPKASTLRAVLDVLDEDRPRDPTESEQESVESAADATTVGPETEPEDILTEIEAEFEKLQQSLPE